MPFRPEDAELRELAALLVDPAEAASPRDWNGVVERALEERVAPLLSRALPADASIPEGLRAVLKRELYRCSATSQLLFGELARLLREGRRRGLTTPVVLKGGALAPSLYEDVALRPMGDIDLLVPKPELSSWLDAGGTLGLHRLGPEMTSGLAERLHYQHALANDRAMIELHFGLLAGGSDWRAPEMQWFQERTERWRPPPGVESPEARTLLPTAHLLYACGHAILQHGAAQSPLVWLYDIHALATVWRERIEWSELAEAARAFRWSAAVSEALTLAKALFGTSVPCELEPALGAPGPGALHARLKASPGLTRAELVWREMGCVGLRDRLRWALAILFPSPTYMKWRYPKVGRLWPATYPYRWSVVFREGLIALLSKRPQAG